MYSKYDKFVRFPKAVHVVIGLVLVIGCWLVFRFSTPTLITLLVYLAGALQARRIAETLLRLKIRPNQVTVVGFLLALTAFWPLVKGRLELGLLLFLASILLDVLDGFMARLGGLSSQRGSFLDSVLDRVADGCLFGGLTLYYAALGEVLWVGLSLAALVGAVMVSYTRAKAERYIKACEVGLLGERPDRNFMVLTAGISGWLWVGVGLVVIFTWLTTIRRIKYAWDRLEKGGEKDESRPQAEAETSQG